MAINYINFGYEQPKPSAFIISAKDGTVNGAKIQYRDENGKLTNIGCINKLTITMDPKNGLVVADMNVLCEIDHVEVETKQATVVPEPCDIKLPPSSNIRTIKVAEIPNCHRVRDIHGNEYSAHDPDSECPCGPPGHGLRRRDCNLHNGT